MKLVLSGGEGFGFHEIKNTVNNARDFIEIILRPSLEMIAELYCTCTAVILPSMSEGFGRPILEAMYSKKPIVLSRIPTSCEIAGSTGHYFDLGSEEQLFQAVNDAFNFTNKDLWARQSRNKLDYYSWENLSRRYLEIYKKVRPSE
jgi:glycosyltransferase involved in cell wall biosynthesis